ncbi:PEP-CTERM sorting domain-containing protein [Colwelliaceae bacterium 6441]
MKNVIKLISLSLLFTFAIHNSANANLITTLEGQHGLINVNENPYDDMLLGSGINYSLDILDENSSLNIVAFAVSNSSYASSLTTNRTGWTASRISKGQWDAGFTINAFHNDLTTNNLGSFTSLFGEDYDVNIFMMPASNDNNSIIAASDEAFQFTQISGIGWSDFIAIDINGAMVDHSRAFPSEGDNGAVDVPEPSTLVLFGAAMFGLNMRRKKTK